MTLRFSHFFWITPNKSKCEIGGIGILKGIQIALCGMKCVNLKTNIITIIEIHFSYNTRLENFFAKSGNAKLKHTTLCNEYEKGGLKSVDIFSKITSL